jgi:dolichol-phosphate mannosyltransferase
VGGSGVLVNLGCFYGFQKYGLIPLYASALAIEVSILSNFVLNDQWTFKNLHHVSWRIRLAKFHSVSFIGALLQWGIFWATSQWYSTWESSTPGGLYLCQLMGIGLGTIWNFLANLMWTWKSKEEGKKTLFKD